MKKYAYDVEVFKNLFTATFVNVDDEKEKEVFYIGFEIDQRKELRKFLRNRIELIGYNNQSYDDPVLRFVIEYNGEDITSKLFELSSKLTDDNFRRDEKILNLRYPQKMVYPWSSIDLMRILAFDTLGVSLKQTSINLKWHKIQDLPIYFDSKVEPEQLQMVLDYNLNDVLITKRLYEEIEPIRTLREQLSRLYYVDLSSASDSRVANILLEKIYSDELKIDIRSIRSMRTNRPKILLGDCVAKFVKFRSPLLNEMLERISSSYVYDVTNYRYSEKIYFANCTFALGIGGLHTEDAPGIFKSDSEYLIQDMDVASYYPNLIINNNFYPQHLGADFIKVLKRITAERLKAKHDGDKVKADGLKITINSIFGKLGSKTFWLYDPKQFLSTTVSGQMGLLMLIEDLHDAGIEVISANTDGVVCRIKRTLLDKYYEVAKKWEEKTNLELEFTPYKKYVRRDVNSYITEKEDGTTKEKGIFLKEVDLKKGYRMPIVPKALSEYFIHGVPVRETISKSRDIMDFCISQKSGSNFIMELYRKEGTIPLQKTNRFYVSKAGGVLIKRDQWTNKKTGLYVGNTVEILNDFNPETPFEQYNVDLYFYENEAMKIIEEIEPSQLSLFDVSAVEGGNLVKNDSLEGKELEYNANEEATDIDELNKLGKNQLLKRLDEMSKAGIIIDEISPRYVLIKNFDSKKMSIDFYSLKKGTSHSIKIDRKAYNETGIVIGALVFCEEFIKKKGEHVLSKYRISDKIEREEAGLF